MRVLAILCSVAILALTACNHAPPTAADTHDADVTSLRATEAQWVRDYAARDLDKLVAHYADDAVLMIPNVPAARGKDAIRKAVEGFLQDTAMAVTFAADQVEVAKSGELGCTRGTYQLTMTDPVTHKLVHDHGNYVATYRKQADGSWRAIADVEASELPLPVPSKK